VQVLLAAGRSSRMRRSKALLDFDGRTPIDLAFAAAHEGGVAESVLVLGADSLVVIPQVIPEKPLLTIHVVENPDPESEQLRSLQLALARLLENSIDFEAFFVHPCDYPLVTGLEYRRLLAAFAADGGAGRVYVPSHANRRGHPLLCAREVARDLLALPAGATAREVIDRGTPTYVLMENPGVIEDMDTPEDYQRLLALYRGSRP
jgi:molybdenum cofactor cytidylyltransferase